MHVNALNDKQNVSKSNILRYPSNNCVCSLMLAILIIHTAEDKLASHAMKNILKGQ